MAPLEKRNKKQKATKHTKKTQQHKKKKKKKPSGGLGERERGKSQAVTDTKMPAAWANCLFAVLKD